MARFSDGFQNSAVNLEKSLAFCDEHIRHKKLRFAVPFGNTFFSRSIYYSVAEWKKTLCASWAKLNLLPPLKGFFLIRRGYDSLGISATPFLTPGTALNFQIPLGKYSTCTKYFMSSKQQSFTLVLTLFFS